MKPFLRLTFLAGLLLGVASPAQAQERGKPKEKDPPAEQRGSVFTDVEIKIIRDYYARAGYQPKPLPPGIAKNLARGKPLPPGIAKTRLPRDLIVKLPPRPGFEIAIVGDRIAMLDRAGIVVDIAIGIFR